MFDNNEDEYIKATQDAQVNAYGRKRGMGSIVIWNLFILLSFAVLSYLGYNYLRGNTTIFKDSLPQKTVVMGVSDTKSDSEYLEMLNSVDVDSVERSNKEELSLSEAINDVINTSTLRDNSLYTQAIAQEIDGNNYDDKEHYNESPRVIFVEKGDTLTSISERYYGNSMDFNKIIDANDNLSRENYVIHVGQKLNIPY
jgi:LysM repeat protein